MSWFSRFPECDKGFSTCSRPAAGIAAYEEVHS